MLELKLEELRSELIEVSLIVTSLSESLEKMTIEYDKLMEEYNDQLAEYSLMEDELEELRYEMEKGK